MDESFSILKINDVPYLMVPLGEDVLMSGFDAGKLLKYQPQTFSSRHPDLLPEPDKEAKGFKVYRKSAVLSKFLKAKTTIGENIENNKQNETSEASGSAG